MRTLLSLISAVSLISGVLGSIDLSTYPLSTILRQGNGEIYSLYWSFNVEEESIRFAVNVSTTGWVGLGLSPDGGMAGSDIVIGWVNSSGQAFLNDRNAPSVGRPPIDVQQDWFLDGGMEENGYTLLAFYRKWVTCDTEDRDIKADTSRVIFSWNEADPANDDPNEVLYHEATNRGSISINLLGGQQDTPPDPVDLQSFSTTVNNINVPDSDTTYWCSAFEVPSEIQQQRRYITKYSSVITEANFLYVHHILIYECDSLNNTHVGYSAPCNSDGGEVGDSVSQCRGGTLIAAWAIGATDFVYPADVAYPFGGPGAPRYVVMETHYDNPSRSSDIMDSSGFEFFYTSTARKYDAGILQVGHSVNFGMVIPPRAENYTIFAECGSDCTSKSLPPEGINIFANVLHTHLAGRGVTLRHFRYTEQCEKYRLEELEPIDQNLQYDFNYQQYNHLPRTVNVLPGDLLRLECNYNTKSRTGVALGGDSTVEEMCLSFPVYYPRVELASCISVTSNLTFKAFVVNPTFVSMTTLNNLIVAYAAPNRNRIESAWNEINWTTDAISALQSSVKEAPLYSVCVPQRSEDRTLAYVTLLPPRCPYKAPDICMSGAASISFSVLLLSVVLLLFGMLV